MGRTRIYKTDWINAQLNVNDMWMCNNGVIQIAEQHFSRPTDRSTDADETMHQLQKESGGSRHARISV
jgi:hypothetical protein